APKADPAPARSPKPKRAPRPADTGGQASASTAPGKPAAAKPAIKPTGRPTDPKIIRNTARAPAVGQSGKAPPAPTWRTPQHQQPQQSPGWILVLIALVGVILAVAGLPRLLSPRPGPEPTSRAPDETGPFRVEAPAQLRVVAGESEFLTLNVRRGGCREPIVV